MKIKDLIVRRVSIQEIREFVETHHYSHNTNGVASRYCFGCWYDNRLVGAMILGPPAMAGQYKKYCERREELVELRRLVMIDDTPKNAESWFIGQVLRYLQRETTLKYVLSYADPHFGHEGTIYKASNFKMMGTTSPTRVIVWNGKSYHDKTLRAKKPYAQKVKRALESGEASWEKRPPKNIYLYTLKAKKIRTSRAKPHE